MLKKLKILSIQSNRLTVIEGLEGLESLEEVYFSHNGIEKIQGLDHNVSLCFFFVVVFFFGGGVPRTRITIIAEQITY
jgi:hypothetical protein